MKLVKTQTIVHTRSMETQMKIHMRLMATQMNMKFTIIPAVRVKRQNKK